MREELEGLAILRMAEVLRLTGLCRTSIYKMMAKEQFPRSVSLSCRSVGWTVRDIKDWLQNRNVLLTTGKTKAAPVVDYPLLKCIR